MNKLFISTTASLLSEELAAPVNQCHLDNIDEPLGADNFEGLLIILGMTGLILGCAACCSAGQFLHKQIMKLVNEEENYTPTNASDKKPKLKHKPHHFTWDEQLVKNYGAPVTLNELIKTQEYVAESFMEDEEQPANSDSIVFPLENSDFITSPMYFSPRNARVANTNNSKYRDEDFDLSSKLNY